MKTLITGDIHNGYGSDKRSLWSMKLMREYADRNKVPHVMVLGDLFDNREALRIDTISDVAQFFKEADTVYNQGWIIFPGNHDMFLRNSWTVNSLQFLEHHTNVIQKIQKFDLDGRTFWVIPFIHNEEVYMKAVAAVSKQASSEDILLTHIGVSGAVMNQCFLLKNWNIVQFKDTVFKYVFTGHFHNHQVIDNKVIYPGSPVAFRFDEGLVDHGFIELDIPTGDWKFISSRKLAIEYGWDTPPDFITITDEDLTDPDIAEIVEHNNVRIALTKSYTQNELETFRKDLESHDVSKVVWYKKKEEQEEIKLDPSQIIQKGILEAYYEHDNPAEISKELLLKLDEEIIEIADEIMSQEEVEAD